jgi:bifunctional DNase/RNase
MSQEPFPGDRPEERGREADEPTGGIQPAGGGFSGEEGGFRPTDLAKLFESADRRVSFRDPESGEAIPLDADSEWFAERQAEGENLHPKKLYEKEVKVAAVYEQRAITGDRAFFVQLKDQRDREIKVYVDYTQATSIAMANEGMRYQRPLTHDLTRTIIERIGWKIDHILIDDLYNETFYAKLSLSRGSESLDIDCRPSDAIALALRSRAPIYVAEEVLKSASREETGSQEDNSPD